MALSVLCCQKETGAWHCLSCCQKETGAWHCLSYAVTEKETGAWPCHCFVLSEEDWSVSHRRLKCGFVFVLCRQNKAEVLPCAVRIRLKRCLVPS